MSTRNLYAVAALALAGTLSAQEAQLTGLASGFVFDEQAKAVREIAGVPGAAYLSRVFAAGDEGSVSPDGQLALVHDGDSLTLIRLGGDAATRLGASSGKLTKIAWSSGSDAVAVSAEGRVRLWIGLGSQPEEVNLAQVSGEVSALAVDSARRAVAVAIEGAVHLATSDGAKLVAEAGDPEGLAIAGNTLYIADRARREVVAVRNFATAPEAALLANEAFGVREPVALAVDGGTLWVADASGKLLSLDLANGAVTRQIDLDFEPTRLEALGRNLYRMDRRTSAQVPVQILQLGSEPAVYFVPAEASLKD